ncbi:S-adenosyl-L-methionine-dependent methyltransferase [Sesbania bispinosa]|nr:S-adenosyl-L-methionine-dependent methyltransferase [Sesbania bispinosa]
MWNVRSVGCGHGLPGIFALLEGAAAVHFQDFNAEVLHCLTIPNLNANLSGKSQPSPSNSTFVTRQNAKHNQGAGYDFILMAETVYSINSLQNLYNLIKKCLRHPDGVVYMAAKKYYFGVGGGSRRFLSVVEKDGELILINAIIFMLEHYSGS